MSTLPCQRHRFDIPREVAYLNCAYMSPLMDSVVEAGVRGLTRKARPWTITPRDFFTDTNQARALFAQLIGATADDIAIVSSLSYGMATAALNVPLAKGQRVILLDEEFPSVILTWRTRAREAGAEVIMIPRPADDDWTSPVLAAIDERTAVAALSQLHWTDGGLLDLEAIGRRLRDVGAALALDVTQSLGAMPFRVANVQPDFLVAACYKWLLGPYTIGFMYVAPRFQVGRPLEHHWFGRAGSEDFGALVNYHDDFQPGARRFDMGETSNFASVPGAIAALRQLLEWQPGQILDTITPMTAFLAEEGKRLGLGSVPAARRAGHYLGLRVPGGVSAGLAEHLTTAQVYVSVRGRNTLRITPHVYNDQADLDRLIHVLGHALK